MFRFKGTVQYVDGRRAEFTAGNAALAAWERYAMRHKLPIGKDSPPTMSSLLIAHHALGIEQGVDAWIESVDGVELVADDGEAGAEVEPVNPTRSVASTG